jgi:hypothetical protein
MGKSPLVPISDIYQSAEPFIGHHHEFTSTELRDLIDLCQLKVIKTNYYNYSMQGAPLKILLSMPLFSIMSLIPSMRECIAVLAGRPATNFKQNR